MKKIRLNNTWKRESGDQLAKLNTEPGSDRWSAPAVNHMPASRQTPSAAADRWLPNWRSRRGGISAACLCLAGWRLGRPHGTRVSSCLGNGKLETECNAYYQMITPIWICSWARPHQMHARTNQMAAVLLLGWAGCCSVSCLAVLFTFLALFQKIHTSVSFKKNKIKKWTPSSASWTVLTMWKTMWHQKFYIYPIGVANHGVMIHGAEGVNVKFVFDHFSSCAFEIRQVYLFRAMCKN